MTEHNWTTHFYITDVTTNSLAVNQGFKTFFELCQWAERNLPDTWRTTGYRIGNY